MDTPVYDFVRRYAASDAVRLHMPGHKGKPFLGCEPWDITEIPGADALYEAEGILRQSEENAAALFGSGRTVYSTEGASQCIRAMVYLAVTLRPAGAAPVIVAARNAHKSFLYAAALSDASIVWLWPERRSSLCACPVSPDQLRRTLNALPALPAAVYLTSPDYLGGMAEIPALAEVSHGYGVPLLVDNAHGAYLRFLAPSRHPLDQGADLCCDSAHKTFPVLTGGAYLHIHKNAPASFRQGAKGAMALFGSTSPSYLILASLDRCNRYLRDDYPARLQETVRRLDALRTRLRRAGWQIRESDPLRVTLRGDGERIAECLANRGVQWEYADRDYVVLMATPENSRSDLDRAAEALGVNPDPVPPEPSLPLARGETVLSPRQALFAPRERIPVRQALGRICGGPTVGCPPAIPVVSAGERIGPEALALLQYYGVRDVEVVRDAHSAL